MSNKAVAAIEDYLVGRLARLEVLREKYTDQQHKLPALQTQIAEARLTLKKVREIAAKQGKP